MNKKQHNLLTLSASMILFFVLWCVLFPHYRYILDNDAVGYLTISKRVASGDWYNSINGLWSPLSSWILVPFIQNNCNAFNTALAINAFCAASIIVLTYFLLQRFVSNNFYKNIMLLALPFILVYFSYMQVFADVLQIDLLLIYLLIVTHNNFFKHWWRYIMVAFIIALAHLSKAYSLAFFVLHFATIHVWHFKNTKQFNLVKVGLTLGLVLLLLLPWALQLKHKYGTFTYMGNAGKLNMSWNLIAGKNFKDSILLLIPPTYQDSPCFWEDPFASQGILHTPFESSNMLLHWIARIGHTCITAIVCANEISFLLIPILILALFYFLKTNNKINIITLAGIILPLGYLSMHIETRYIWLLTFLIIIIGGVLVQKILNTIIQKVLSIIFALSLVIFPFYNMEILYNKGQGNFKMAHNLNNLKLNNISFTSNSISAGNMWVIAYLTDNKFYTIEKTNYAQLELEQEFKRYKVQYYLQTNENNCLNNTIISNEYEYKKIFFNNEYSLYQLIEK
jgi:hypothetical protein